MGRSRSKLRPVATPALSAVPAPHPLRYGVVDMGSNAIRVQIVEVLPSPTGRGPGITRELESHREPVRLGQGVFLTGRIPEAAMVAAVEVFRRFSRLCQDYSVDHIRAIATSATREASNGDELLERIREASGVSVEVIDGSEEAYLLNVAVKTRIDLTKGKSVLVDLGGGSVEVTLVEDGQVLAADSYQLGAVRLLHALSAHGEDDQAGQRPFLELLEQYVGSLDTRIRDRFGSGRVHRYVATGGNIETLADLVAMDGQLQREQGVDAIPLDSLAEWARRLATLGHAERVSRFGLKPDRADTILPAAVVYYRIGRAARLDKVLVPRVGLREGLMHEVAAGHLRAFRAIDHQETVLSACRGLGRKYHYDEPHAERVRRLAMRIFEQTAELHELGGEERILLEAAALLHDIGAFVSNARHHKHSYYLIASSDLVGLAPAERALVAHIARYHRGRNPDRDGHAEYGRLGRKRRARVLRLAAILRLADALDREHQGKVEDVKVRLGRSRIDLELQLTPHSQGQSLALESWAVEQKGGLFTAVFGLEVRVAP